MQAPADTATPTPARFATAAGWGATATVVMAAVMFAGLATGVSPIPKPIPAALVGHTIGGLPQPAVIGLALAAHLSYGALAGGLAASVWDRVTLAGGLAVGAGLWVVMGLVWLPYLGWGWFGLARSPAIAVATLGLHLIYGATFGWLMARRHAPA